MSLDCFEPESTADVGSSEEARFRQLIRQDGRYPLAAFEFLYRGLDYATRERYGETTEQGPRHVSGQELCCALRDMARRRWGPLARSVLACWNIHRSRDFGEMVFLLVNHEFMGRQDSDRVEDFDDVFDFADAFRDYEIPLERFDMVEPSA